MADTAAKQRRPQAEVTGVPGVVIGTVEGATQDGRPLVQWAAGGGMSVVAQAVWMEVTPDWSGCKGLRAVIGFESGDETKPLLLGLLDSPRPAATISKVTNGQSGEVHSLRPKVLRIESEQELILECGEAKIALRADGRVVILGGYLLSRSKGVNKIKGGSVQIN